MRVPNSLRYPQADSTVTIPASAIAKLAAIGLTAEQAAAVAEVMADVEVATAAVHEASKAKARDRVAKWREKQAGNVTKRNETSRNGLRGRDARVEDKTSNTDIEPQEKKGAKRAMRLPSDWTLPAEWRLDALDAGLPENQIDLQAATMRDWSRSAPKGAKTDWRAAWRNWCRRSAEDARARAGPVPVPTQSEVFAFIGRQENGQQEREDRSGIRPAVSHLSAVK